MIVASLFSFLSPTHWLNVIAKDIGNAATAALTDVGSFMASSTQLTFGLRYTQLYDDGLELAILIGAGAILYGGAAAALSGDIKRLTSALARVVVAIMGSFVLLTLVLMVQKAIFQVDQGIAGTFQQSGKQLGATLSAVGAGLAGITTVGGPAFLILLAIALLVGALAVYAVLIMTAAIAYVTCFFAPLAWVVSAKAGKKAIELLVAMLLTPFVITCVLAVGLSLTVDGSGVITHITHTLMGLGLLYVAIFAPLALMRFMPIAESHVANLRHPHQSAMNTGSTMAGAHQKINKKLETHKGSKTTESPGVTPSAAGTAAGVAAGTAGKAGEAVNRATTEPMNAANATATPSQAPQGAPMGGGVGGSRGSSPHSGQSSPGGDQHPHSTEPHTRQANPPPNPAGGSGGSQP